jgi:hypothetical protein
VKSAVARCCPTSTPTSDPYMRMIVPDSRIRPVPPILSALYKLLPHPLFLVPIFINKIPKNLKPISIQKKMGMSPVKIPITCRYPFLSLAFLHASLRRFNYHFSSNSKVASPDALIAIVSGLIGAIMSFVGVVIAYLTLRSMNIEMCTLLVFALSFTFSLFALSFATVDVDVNYF